MDFPQISCQLQEACGFLPPRFDYRQPQVQIANSQPAEYYDVAGSSWMHPHPPFLFHQRPNTDYYSLLDLRSNLLQCMHGL